MTEAMSITAQEVFNTVAEHLFTQGAPAGKATQVGKAVTPAGEKFVCEYRAPDGKKCAVGALIPDDTYHTGLEGLRAHMSEVRAALPEQYREHGVLLTCLQSVHDTTKDSARYPEEFDGSCFGFRYSSWTSPEALFRNLSEVAKLRGLSAEHFRGRQFGPVTVAA